MDARNILADSLATTTLETPYAWPQLSLAMRVEADIAQAARAAGTDLDTEHAARITAIAEAAATLADDLPALQGYIALTAAEAERASANPVLEAWSTAADAWRAAGELPRLAYCLFRLADAQLLTGERTAAASSLIEAAEIAADLRAKSLLDEIEDLAKRARIPLGGEPVEETDENQRLGLTAREIEVLRLLADGRSNLDIAERLYISRKTASVHVSNILAKLGAGNRGEAAAIAFRTGLLT